MKELRILLADDDKDDILFFREALEELPLSTHLTTVKNGEDLMHQLLSGCPLPDILFLDLNMPRKNGFTCLTEIKGCEVLKRLPVIIFSTSCDENLAEWLFKNGANHFICKPADFSLLKQVIHQAIIQTVKENYSQPTREAFMVTQLKSFRH